ncbi:MAG: hypothetical protein ACE5G3_09905 [Gammaproteobacteria bacterium]
MTTERDYGSGGRLALATPQGNPTVEPEMRRLFPMDVEYYTLRLTSRADDPRQRMIDYLAGLPAMAERFAGMPSLPLIGEFADENRPIVSSNLALATAGLLSLNRSIVMAGSSGENIDD